MLQSEVNNVHEISHSRPFNGTGCTSIRNETNDGTKTYGSFYKAAKRLALLCAVEQLHKNDYIEIADVIKDSNRPDKTIYRITESGKKQFHKLILEELSSESNLYHPLFTGVAFALHGNPQEAADILEKRVLLSGKRVNELSSKATIKAVFHLIKGNHSSRRS